MPVEEHPVHERTMDTGRPYICRNRPAFADGYWAPDRTRAPDGRFVTSITWIPHCMSTECRYDMSLTDAKCTGCRERGIGEARSERIRREGS